MKRLFCLCILLCFLFSPAHAVVIDSQLGPIVITEIGAYESSGYEWIEIMNISTSSINMNDWIFFENNSNHGLELVSGSSTFLAPQEIAIITQNNNKFFENYHVTNTVFDSSWGSLKESGEEIGLKTSSSTFSDFIFYSSSTEYSLEKIIATSTNTSSLNWKEHPNKNSVGKKNYWFQKIYDVSTTTNEVEIINTSTIELVTTTESVTTTENQEVVSSTNIFEENIIFTNTTKIRINEIYPNPIDIEKEWIELFYFGTSTINLENWKIQDAVGDIFSFSTSTVLVSSSYYVVELAANKLNNFGDTVSLLNSTFSIIDSVTYTEEDIKEKGNSFIFWENSYLETVSTTKGFKNILKIKETVKKDENKQTINTNKSYGSSLVKSKPKPKENNIITTCEAKNKVIISEIFPNPAGEDVKEEFIELFNTKNIKIALDECKITDNSAKNYKFKDVFIDPFSYYVLKREDSGISLNNNGDHVYFLDENDEIIDNVNYEKAEQEKSLSLIENNFVWTKQITPGKENIFYEENNIQKVLGEKIEEINKIDEKVFISNNQVEEVEKNNNTVIKDNKVLITDIVTVLPGVFGTQYFYIGITPGIQVYMYNKDFPEFEVGDVVTVAGEIGEAQGNVRIKVKNLEDITVDGIGHEVIPIQASPKDFTVEHIGSFIKIKGEITEKKGSRIFFDDGESEFSVYIKKGTEISTKNYESGKKYEVIGILQQTAAGIELLPRSVEDIVLLEENVLEVVSTTANEEEIEKVVVVSKENKLRIIWQSIVSIILLALGIAIFLYKKYKQKTTV